VTMTTIHSNGEFKDSCHTVLSSRGPRQGDGLSRVLFNGVLEYIVRNFELTLTELL
jgi:hypothetical protein